MSDDFGVPPIAAENRVLVEQRLEEVHEAGRVAETVTVEFRNQRIHVEVIDMPIDRLYYNPGTHRVRAQRSHDPARDQTLKENPWVEESQEYLHYLLTALPADPSVRDPDFEQLKESLREDKQNEPGLITRDGILVNGNTRQAALKELGVTHIRVGVLPATTTWVDINNVELALQLRRDRRRDYSYINHLLAVDEQTRLGMPVQEIARNFRTTSPAVERDIWIINQLRDMIRRSEDNGFALRLMDFEDAKEKLFELFRAYSKEHSKNKERADILKESRLTAIVFNFAKTDVRYIEPDFRKRYLDSRLPESAKPDATAPSSASKNIPGLNRQVRSASVEVVAARNLTDMVLKSKAVQKAGDKATPEQVKDATKVFNDLHSAFDDAVDLAGREHRLRKKRHVAPDRVEAAASSLEQCITDLALARGNASLDEGAFDDALVRLREVMSRLAAEAEKSMPLASEGVRWLRDASGTE